VQEEWEGFASIIRSLTIPITLDSPTIANPYEYTSVGRYFSILIAVAPSGLIHIYITNLSKYANFRMKKETLKQKDI